MNAKTIAPKTLAAPVTAIAKAMKKAEAEQPAIQGGHDKAVAKLISEAMKASDTLTARAKLAAKLASSQFNPELKPAANVKAVAALYAEDFKDKDGKENSNVKSIFTDCLWLLAAAAAPVSFVSTLKDKAEVHTTADKAVDLSKNEMRAAAKAVRDDLGAGRASGGGRTRADTTPTQQTGAHSADTAAQEPGPVKVADAETVFLANLAAYLTDVAMIAKIKATCTEAGFSLTRKAAKK